ncbi:hypothetical protein TNCV_3281871 [Trichonephila clavipes]|nr:hypothetical protein TNCV_3281871 [Trichonephila clavipes]
MSALTTEFLERFGVKVVIYRSSVYHPQSNPVERMHTTLKNILRVLCLEAITNWEKILPQALFALRTVIHDSTGFSPAELVHGKNLRTPVMLLYEKLTEEEHVESSVVDYVFELINRMKRCQEMATLHMEDAKQKQKLWYDRRTVKRQFQLGELVLVIAPSRPNKLSVQWVGPGEIVQQLSETNYVVKFPEKDKTHVYHVNMLKPYHQREENINLLCVNPLKHDEEKEIPSLELENERTVQRKLLYEHSNLFSNIPGCTDLAEHDIKLESERAIVAKPYLMSPRQIEILKSEVNKMLELKIIEPGESDFTSPLILVEAQGKEARPCIDYRRLNKVTRTQFFPLPNIEELLEKVSAAKYISILYLTPGYWQIPLSSLAQSRLMANLLINCEDFAVLYLDDIAIFSLAWDDHLKHPKEVFDRLRSAKLHIKPSKCQFAQAYVKYLGHLVGQGLRTPGELKVQVIKDFPIPTNKTQCDASNLGIGVVLSQVCENEEYPIMFLRKKLSLAEQKYSTTEKECAAIIFAVQKLKCYLDGHQKFVIQTDHNPLVWYNPNTGLLYDMRTNTSCVADPDNTSHPVYDTFQSDLFARKWIACCRAAIECCEKMRKDPLPPEDDFTRGRIIGKIEEGRNITDVAREFDIAHSVVSRLWKSFKTIGMCSRRHVVGRVRSTTPAEGRYIVLSAKRNRRKTAQQVANQFLAASGKQISRKTVARRLRGGGLYARRPVVCVPLTRQHRTARLQWCREHHNWTEQNWACVLFSDESRFSLSSDCRRQLIWRESGTAYRPENIQ